MSFASVDLPAPVVPTSAIVCPAGISSEKFGRIVLSSLYANVTSSKRMCPRDYQRSTGFSGSGTVGTSSRTPDTFSSAAVADW